MLGQRGPRLELIAIDDGSSDGSARIAARASGVVHVSTGGKGLVGALRAGCAVARAPVLARMDADDVALARPARRPVRGAARAAAPGRDRHAGRGVPRCGRRRRPAPLHRVAKPAAHPRRPPARAVHRGAAVPSVGRAAARGARRRGRLSRHGRARRLRSVATPGRRRLAAGQAARGVAALAPSAGPRHLRRPALRARALRQRQGAPPGAPPRRLGSPAGDVGCWAHGQAARARARARRRARRALRRYRRATSWGAPHGDGPSCRWRRSSRAPTRSWSPCARSEPATRSAVIWTPGVFARVATTCARREPRRDPRRPRRYRPEVVTPSTGDRMPLAIVISRARR